MTDIRAPLLTVDRLGLELGGRTVLHDIRFQLHPGEVLAVTGPNGGGKTTLLRTLLGLCRPLRGSVRWSSHPPSSTPSVNRRIRCGYVPQQCNTDRAFPLSAREVLAQGAPGRTPIWGSRRRDGLRRVELLLSEFGLEPLADRRFVDLSGGQQRRLLMARALLGDPVALLLDEPTAGVDLPGQGLVAAHLDALVRRGVAILLVTHDLPFATRCAHRLARLATTLSWIVPRPQPHDRTSIPHPTCPQPVSPNLSPLHSVTP